MDRVLLNPQRQSVPFVLLKIISPEDDAGSEKRAHGDSQFHIDSSTWTPKKGRVRRIEKDYERPASDLHGGGGF
jgi:hypothetical protein